MTKTGYSIYDESGQIILKWWDGWDRKHVRKLIRFGQSYGDSIVVTVGRWTEEAGWHYRSFRPRGGR
jgi:hypothetical protein